MTPKAHIEDIQNSFLKADKKYVLTSLYGAIDRIKKAFPRYGSFLMEFIQNAEDAHSSSIKIEILDNAVRIFNDGNPFSSEDVDNICKVGESSKTPEEYIGYLGVGFKSVFLISECIEIYSGEYKFKFDKNYFSHESDRIPWQVIPIWIEHPTISFLSDYTTVFNIHIKESQFLEKLQEETKSEFINNRILLFLRYIEKIEIKDTISGTERSIQKHPPLSKTDKYKIYLIEEYSNRALSSQERWLVFSAKCKVEDDVKNDPITKEWERDKVTTREVVVAFRLDEKGDLIIEEKGTAHIGVFSFLPLKEVESGLNFLIQADFLTGPARVELARDCLWNDWLAKEIYELIINKCIPIFLEHERWKKKFIKILYSPPLSGHELFEYNIKKPLREYLENCLIARDGSKIKLNKAIFIEPAVEELLNKNDVKTLYPDRKVLDSDLEIPWEMQSKIKKGPNYSSSGIDSEMERLLELKIKQKDINFFKKFYQGLSVYKESTLRKSGLRSQDIILTDEWDLIDPRTVYIKPHNLTIPLEIKENFKIVHPDLLDEEKIIYVLKALGIEELTTEHIQDILKTKEIPHIGKIWRNLSKEEKIRKTKIFKELWDKHQINIRDLGFLTLMSKDGEWLKPADLVFSKVYKPDHRIEELTEKGLLTSEDLQRLNIKFVTNEYLYGDNNEDIKSWHDFFKELGLERNLDKEKIVQRIAINTALLFEKVKGRIARELSRSEETGGYDIESNSGERLIEVKGRSSSSPQIWLTPTQHKRLYKKGGEKYFLYIVRDALNNPTLSEIKGSNLLNVDYSISIDFYKWKDLSEEEFQP